MKNKSILVIFGKELPKKNKRWFARFDEVLSPKEVQELTDPGSIQEACQLVGNLSRLTLPDGSRLPKMINYRGYELWWMHYDKFMDSFCLPYTQYSRLLSYLKDFDKAYLYRAPYPSLFQYFLRVHNRECHILNKSRFRKLIPIPMGVLAQVIISLPFLLWLKITRPKLMVFISDQFDLIHPPHDYDFRFRHIYEELREKKIPFVEFIRSQESLLTILKHAWRRKRPVVYSTAVIAFLYVLASCFQKKQEKKMIDLSLSSGSNPEERFWFLAATHRLHNLKGTIWSIRAMEFILRWIGTRAAIIPASTSRTLHEILACKLNGIKTVGIQHGLMPRYYVVYEFMPGFDGRLTLTTDMYGLWSDWWREYFIANSRAYRPEQLFVSGHMRPLRSAPPGVSRYCAAPGGKQPIKVLFMADQLADPHEVIPYFLALLGKKEFSVYVKFRAYRDIFEDWLKENQPQLLEKMKVIRGDIHEAISRCDVAVGCHSTGVLESVMQFKPFVFFRTGKWGDYFDIKSFDSGHRFFAENPSELLDKIRKSREIPKEVLMGLREKYFGDPHRNGSKWVVDQAVKFL